MLPFAELVRISTMPPKTPPDKYVTICATFTGWTRRFVATQPSSPKSIQTTVASHHEHISFSG